MVNDHYPVFKWLFHWEYTQHFQVQTHMSLHCCSAVSRDETRAASEYLFQMHSFARPVAMPDVPWATLWSKWSKPTVDPTGTSQPIYHAGQSQLEKKNYDSCGYENVRKDFSRLGVLNHRILRRYLLIQPGVAWCMNHSNFWSYQQLSCGNSTVSNAGNCSV